uniref:hypothetical protein n=1 Tax=Microbacterium ureisolvens TaxID=2781186 RepID=UPI0035B1CC5B
MTHNQSPSTTLISEVLAEPELTHSDVFRRMRRAGLQDLIDAEANRALGNDTGISRTTTETPSRRWPTALPVDTARVLCEDAPQRGRRRHRCADEKTRFAQSSRYTDSH